MTDITPGAPTDEEKLQKMNAFLAGKEAADIAALLAGRIGRTKIEIQEALDQRSYDKPSEVIQDEFQVPAHLLSHLIWGEIVAEEQRLEAEEREREEKERQIELMNNNTFELFSSNAYPYSYISDRYDLPREIIDDQEKLIEHFGERGLREQKSELNMKQIEGLSSEGRVHLKEYSSTDGDEAFLINALFLTNDDQLLLAFKDADSETMILYVVDWEWRNRVRNKQEREKVLSQSLSESRITVGGTYGKAHLRQMEQEGIDQNVANAVVDWYKKKGLVENKDKKYTLAKLIEMADNGELKITSVPKGKLVADSSVIYVILSHDGVLMGMRDYVRTDLFVEEDALQRARSA